MANSRINIGKDFNKYPVGRYLTEGNANGQLFRENFLLPALNKGAIEVLLDDAFGYGSSFLEEAFGGLIRAGLSLLILRSSLLIVTEDDSLQREIWQYIEDASKKARK